VLRLPRGLPTEEKVPDSPRPKGDCDAERRPLWLYSAAAGHARWLRPTAKVCGMAEVVVSMQQVRLRASECVAVLRS
jgi:hypothetical protein